MWAHISFPCVNGCRQYVLLTIAFCNKKYVKTCIWVLNCVSEVNPHFPNKYFIFTLKLLTRSAPVNILYRRFPLGLSTVNFACFLKNYSTKISPSILIVTGRQEQQAKEPLSLHNHRSFYSTDVHPWNFYKFTGILMLRYLFTLKCAFSWKCSHFFFWKRCGSISVLLVFLWLLEKQLWPA